MFICVIIFLSLISFFLIWKGSDWLTDSLVPVAHRLGTSYIAITTLMVSFLLSTPEIFSAVYSYLFGHVNIGIGVVIGSVIMNIGICVGLSALIRPLSVEKSVVIRDGIYLVIAAVIVMLFGADLHYERVEGIILLLLFIPYALNVWAFEKWRPQKHRRDKVVMIKKKLNLIGHMPFLKSKPSIVTFFIGAALLIVGSYLFSLSLIKMAEVLKFPDLIIGLVVGAIGTGIPNIAAAVQGTIKGYEDAAITETIGSNVYTLLITLGILVVLSPFFIAGKIFYFDLTWMIIINLLMIAFIFKGYKYRERSITRFEGAILLLFYLVLLVINIVGINF